MVMTLLLVMVSQCVTFQKESEFNLNIFWCFFFLSIAIGPFVFSNDIRRHSHLELVFFFLVCFILFHTYSSIQMLDPHINSTDSKRNCSFTMEHLYSQLDIFNAARFVEWVIKTLLIRHTGLSV